MPEQTPIESKFTVNNDTGCWEWNKPLNTGYGLVRHNGRQVGAHRVMYELRKGPVPGGLEIDHKCRNPRCVNPDHLEAVTRTENVRRGNVAKLTPFKVEKLRVRYRDGETLESISSDTGISVGHLSQIVSGKYWKDAPGPIVRDGRKRPKVARRKLSNADIDRIRDLRSSGFSRDYIAKMFSVSIHTVSRVSCGKGRFSMQE